MNKKEAAIRQFSLIKQFAIILNSDYESFI